jgi:acyl-homoserine lactone synthase
MVHVVTSADRARFAEPLAQMHRDRKRVFVDRLGWKVPVVDGQYEIDQFDTEDAVYLLALDEAGRHAGSIRLMPSTKPHLLSDVFPHLCEEDVPISDEVWEITRLVTSPDLASPGKYRQQLMVAVIEFALLYGVRRYTCVSHVQYLSQVLAVGWDCEPLGLPQPGDDGMMAGAIAISITPDTLSLVRGRAGLRSPILRWEVRDAA